MGRVLQSNIAIGSLGLHRFVRRLGERLMLPLRSHGLRPVRCHGGLRRPPRNFLRGGHAWKRLLVHFLFPAAKSVLRSFSANHVDVDLGLYRLDKFGDEFPRLFIFWNKIYHGRWTLD